MAFRDHFSEHASVYSQHRPDYPIALFEYLAELAPSAETVWDCGTGNGQCAKALRDFFSQVVATDASADQLRIANRAGNIHYLREEAEEPSLKSNSIDLVTVAVAIHWFALNRFYPEVQRVLKPCGVIAAWGYHLPTVNHEIDQILHKIYDLLVGYWPEGFELLDNQYKSIPFPFTEITPPKFYLHKDWDLRQLAGFIGSWSGSQRYIKVHDEHPVEKFWDDLEDLWGDPEQTKTLKWPLFMRVGRSRAGEIF